jgi:hypothetical protein
MRPCDLVVCGECLAVRYIGTAKLEIREAPGWNLMGGEEVIGVFCPGCDQLLYDAAGWEAHRVLQRHYDAELKRRKAAELPIVSVPLDARDVTATVPVARDRGDTAPTNGDGTDRVVYATLADPQAAAERKARKRARVE